MMDGWIDEWSEPIAVPGTKWALTTVAVSPTHVFIVVCNALGMLALKEACPKQKFPVPDRTETCFPAVLKLVRR